MRRKGLCCLGILLLVITLLSSVMKSVPKPTNGPIETTSITNEILI